MNEPPTIVPLISSSVSGPLGACHLPRLWAKVLLDAKGRLPAGYRSGIGGFDEAVCEALGIDAAAFVAFVRAALPTYDACEAWVRATTSGLDAGRLGEFNRYVAMRELEDGRAAERRAALGISDVHVRRAVALNDLEDWRAFHAGLTQESATDPSAD